MTDHAKKQFQRRQLFLNIRRKKRFLFLALVLFLGSGAFLFHKEKFYAISEILTWLKHNNPGETLASIPTDSPRGYIYDRNFRPLAATYETYALYARPLEIKDPTATAELLEEFLGAEKNNLKASLKSERGFVWVAKEIDQPLADTIKNRNIKGIYQVVEAKRFYPNYETAAHAVGFVENGHGLDGMEFQYNSLLRGDEVNHAELEALHMDSSIEFDRSPTHLVMNLDLMIQAKIERFLERRVRITGAASGAVLLMDAHNGAVLAMASYPVFNPNRYWEFSSTALNNRVVSEPVYPGELALIFQQAAAINLNNEKKSQSIDNAGVAETIPVLEPEILKRRRLSVAPKVDDVDPEYFYRFTQLLGFEQKPLTDISLKNETSVSPSLTLTSPGFHSSALRLLTGFTALVNNGKIVTPHLLHTAYPKENPSPVVTNLTGVEQSVSLHSDTSKDLLDFLAAKWLKINNRNRSAQTPMFFETHRFVKNPENSERAKKENDAAELNEQVPRITQSLMLGAIPGRDPKLTMIALLSYPDCCTEVYPDTPGTIDNKFSILSPDEDMIQKMLYVAGQPLPIPSPDFWSNGERTLAKNIDAHAAAEKNFAAESANSKKNMPDVTGKSLRAGLQVLQHFNLDIKLVGSGWIVSQHPAAGAEFKAGAECILEMQQEI